jgi:hypothetical protein
MTPDRSDHDDGGAGARLAERFSADAEALRRRAEQLDAPRPGAGRGAAGRPQPGAPSAAACRQMADACDRVSALLTGARDAATLGALIPLLEQTLADERSADARHVYAGALTRLRQAVGDDALDDDDEDDEDDDENDDEDDGDEELEDDDDGDGDAAH